jgi:phosphoenolpyruvate-protein phosphotransferase (PTS system enzyme I)
LTPTPSNLSLNTASAIGIAASPGWAIATAYVLNPQVPTAAYYPVDIEQIPHEQAQLTAAFTAVREELLALAAPLKPLAEQGLAHQAVYALLEMQLVMLDDPALYDATLAYIASEHVNGAWALSQQTQRLAASFESMSDTYFRERALDVRQLGQRLLSHVLTPHANGWTYAGLPQALQGTGDIAAPPTILVAQDVPPAYFAQWYAPSAHTQTHSVQMQNAFTGLITELGGYSSHTAIMARSHGIPAVLGIAHALDRIQTGDLIAFNGSTGELWIKPTHVQLVKIYAAQAQWDAQQALAAQNIAQAAITQCGKTITVLGNIEQPSDMPSIISAHLDGVGLFRTEFLFMGKTVLPSEAEQTAAYSAVMKALNGKPAIIRTLDVGADKLLNTAHARESAESPNPALGLRAIRYSLAHPELFLVQLRALLQAAQLGLVKILLPMIANADELQQCRAYLDQAQAQLQAQGVAYGVVELGVMIEIPAAAIAIDTLLPYVDFCSVGTNDLIQYALAIDRTDATVAHLYNPAHPAIAYLLSHVFKACDAAGKPVSVCGEMAGDVRYTHTLLDLGLRTFSLNVNQAAAVKTVIRQWHEPRMH